ncbi:MAG TPA: ABC transporter permease subunit, partial [Planctomycetota bacterium]|nr:ABC transporter permease subunit [Planctomycetota bacterium]
MKPALERLRKLERARPRNRVARRTAQALALGVVVSLARMDLGWGRLLAGPDEPGLLRFLEQDAKPFPLRAPGATLLDLGPWLLRILREYGLEGMGRTLAIALVASALAGGFALLVAPINTATLMAKDPFGAAPAKGSPWISSLMRNVCLALRALPEYLLGFLLLALLAGSVWPVVLALALHNGGILGRLFGDSAEDVPSRPIQALAACGSPRAGLWFLGIAPLAFSRWLAFFFYRFETCVREATV